MSLTNEVQLTPTLSSKRLLIVEDERIVALDLRLNLEAMGYTVVAMAASEAEALAQVERHLPDLVLMDINLGRGGDGTVAAQQITQHYGLPVVFLTAYAEPETLARASACAPYGYLLKPFDLREVNATLQMAVARWAQDQHRATLAAGYTGAPNAVVILDAACRVRSVNAAFTALTGWAEHEIVGKHPHEFLHAQREADRLPLPMQAPADYQPTAGEVTCRRRDGTLFPAWEHVAPAQAGVPGFILTFSDITPLSDSRQRISDQAHHDALTGLGNRYELDAVLNRLVGSPLEFALIFLDLDGFKAINDQQGHAIGDLVLTQVAQRLRTHLRETDHAIRLGGDEFVLVVPQPGAGSSIERLAQTLLQAVREPIQTPAGGLVKVSGSIGLARYPQDGTTPDALLSAADAAMYRAKASGRDRFVSVEA